MSKRFNPEYPENGLSRRFRSRPNELRDVLLGRKHAAVFPTADEAAAQRLVRSIRPQLHQLSHQIGWRKLGAADPDVRAWVDGASVVVAVPGPDDHLAPPYTRTESLYLLDQGDRRITRCAFFVLDCSQLQAWMDRKAEELWRTDTRPNKTAKHFLVTPDPAGRPGYHFVERLADRPLPALREAALARIPTLDDAVEPHDPLDDL